MPCLRGEKQLSSWSEFAASNLSTEEGLGPAFTTGEVTGEDITMGEADIADDLPSLTGDLAEGVSPITDVVATVGLASGLITDDSVFITDITPDVFSVLITDENPVRASHGRWLKDKLSPLETAAVEVLEGARLKCKEDSASSSESESANMSGLPLHLRLAVTSGVASLVALGLKLVSAADTLAKLLTAAPPTEFGLLPDATEGLMLILTSVVGLKLRFLADAAWLKLLTAVALVSWLLPAVAVGSCLLPAVAVRSWLLPAVAS